MDGCGDAPRRISAYFQRSYEVLADPTEKYLKRYGPCFVYSMEIGRCVMSRSRRSRKRTRDGAEDEALRRSCENDTYTDGYEEERGALDGADAFADLLPFIDPT